MEDKKKVRELKKDARMERRYGIPVMRKIADNEKERYHFHVANYYYEAREKRREYQVDMLMCIVFLVLGIIELGIGILFSDSVASAVQAFGVSGVIALYWLLSARLCVIESDRALDKLVSMADIESKKEAVKSEIGEKLNGR